MSRKPKAASPENTERELRPLDLGFRYSEDAKKLLVQFFANVVRSLEHDWLHDGSGLGVVAAYLRVIAYHIDADETAFNEASNGDMTDPTLNRMFQFIPPLYGWDSPWPEITNGTKLFDDRQT